jgi:type I restriction enzyme, S subunit
MSELPRGWVEATLGQIGEWSSGGTPSRARSDYYDGEIPWVKTGDLADRILLDTPEKITQAGLNNSSAKLFPPGTLLIAMYGATIGKTALLGIPAATNQACAAFLPSGASKDLIPFLWKFVFAKKTEFISAGQGGAQPNISQALIKQFPIEIPPLAEQKRIVAKLDALSAKSARARTELARIETLVSRYKQVVLSKAFSGELTSAQFAQPDGDRSAGHPAHWRQMQLGEIADIKSGITLGKKRKPDEQLLELPYLRVANVQRGWLDLREIKTIEVTAKEADALFLREGDVLMNEGGDRDKLGRGWVWDGQIHDCIHQNHVFRVRLASGTVPPRFLSYYANEFGQKHFFDEGKQTTNLASISKSKLSAMTVPIPPFEEAKEIVRRIESAFAKIDRLAKEAKRALELVGRLDEAILAKAFRGELVPQDENDEPAELLLARIRAEREAAPMGKRGRKTAP